MTTSDPYAAQRATVDGTFAGEARHMASLDEIRDRYGLTPGNEGDHEAVERLQTLHPPVHPAIAELLDFVKAVHKEIEHTLIERAPVRHPDRTLAWRATVASSQAWTTFIACNQDAIVAALRERGDLPAEG